MNPLSYLLAKYRSFRDTRSDEEVLEDFRENLLTPWNPQHAGEMGIACLESIKDICNIVKPRNIVELGFNRGSSAVMWLLSSNAKLVSVDILPKKTLEKSLSSIGDRFGKRFNYLNADHAHLLYKNHRVWKGEVSPAWEKFRTETGQLRGFSTRAEWMKGTPWWNNPSIPDLIPSVGEDSLDWRESLGVLEEMFPPFDLGFIDGDHSDFAVRRDIDTLLKYNIPYLAFDDYRLNCFNLPKALASFNLEIIKVYDTGNGQILTKAPKKCS